MMKIAFIVRATINLFFIPIFKLFEIFEIVFSKINLETN